MIGQESSIFAHSGPSMIKDSSKRHISCYTSRSHISEFMNSNNEVIFKEPFSKHQTASLSIESIHKNSFENDIFSQNSKENQVSTKYS